MAPRLAVFVALLAAGCAGTPQSDADALNRLGDLRQSQGRYREAVASYEQAAELGSAAAMSNLGRLYELGLGVAQDRRRGLELYRSAADRGSAGAMWSIANLYGAGRVEGRPELMSACIWTVRAQRFADPRDEALAANLRRVLPQFERLLAAEQMAECRREGDAWTPPLRR